MNFCRSCNAQLQENSSFCRVCGARTDIEKTFAPSDRMQNASTSFGDPSQRFGPQAQGFSDRSQEFAERKQNSEARIQNSDTLPQNPDIRGQSPDIRGQNPQAGPQNFERRPQNFDIHPPESAPKQYRQKPAAQQDSSQNTQHTPYNRKFEPYAQQQRMYRKYQDNRQHRQDDAPQILPQHERFKRLGGWLLFFVLGAIFGIFSNLITSVSLLNQIVGVWAYLHLLPDELRAALILELIGGLSMLSLITLQIVFVSAVLRRNPIFLRVEQITYICFFFVQICFVVSTHMAGMLATPGAEALEVIARPFGAPIGLILMTLYYSRSVRVQVYMGSEEFKQKALFTFKKIPLPKY